MCFRVTYVQQNRHQFLINRVKIGADLFIELILQKFAHFAENGAFFCMKQDGKTEPKP